MYHPKVINSNVSKLEAAYNIGVREYSVEEVSDWVDRLSDAQDAKGNSLRTLSGEELQFIQNELILTKSSYKYWGERYCYINVEAHGVERMYPLLESQEIILKKLAEIEYDIWCGRREDGILVNLLKGGRQMGGCLTPDTKILTGDLRWIELDTVLPGMELVGIDEFPKGGKGIGRKLGKTFVVARQDIIKEVYEIKLDNGQVLKASGDHRFLCLKRRNTSTEWRHVKDMFVGDDIRFAVTPWGKTDSDDGWFGGIIDGEGSLRLRTKHDNGNPKAGGCDLRIAQAEGLVLNKIVNYVERNGFKYHEVVDRREKGTSSKLGNKIVHTVCLGRLDEIMEIVGRCRPVRFIEGEWWENREPGQVKGVGWSKILSITPIGEHRVIDLQTSTKTYIANGFVSHNSTLAESILAHRASSQDNLQGLIASDVPGPKGSGYLFGMLERTIDNLPWWLRPAITERVKDTEIVFDGGTHLWVGAGKSVRGTTGQRGQLGRGQALSLIHLSELSTWETAEQIDSALMPTIPRSMRTFVLLESTAKGRNNWWHKHWETTKAGNSRFINIFIPWYAESGKYSLTPKEGWIPSSSTLAYAKRAEEVGGRWISDKVELTKSQLYWYETTRNSYESKDLLTTFLEEYGAVDDKECFQFSGKSIFPTSVIQRIKETAKPLLAVVEIAPHDQLVARSLEGPFDLPTGFGMKFIHPRIWRGWLEQEDLLDSLKGYLLIWEPPRRGHRYILSADIADGIGKDRSVGEITRIATIKEPDEQVAQFVSDSIDSIEFAYYLDVIGRFYKDDDGLEAKAAIECNNMGIATQSELQSHLGYAHFFVWQHLDSVDVAKRGTSRIGWWTTVRTRPMLMSRYIKKVKAVDSYSGIPDYRVNSPFTIEEFQSFQTLTTIENAESDPTNPNAHDDCIMGGAIGVYVAQTEYDGVTEDLDSQRRRMAAEKARRLELAEHFRTRRDFVNCDITYDEMKGYSHEDD